MTHAPIISNCLLWLTLRRLGSAELPTRRRAAEALSQAPSHHALAALNKALADSDPEVRRHAATGLARLEVPERLPGLLKAFQDTCPDVHAIAAAALKQGPPAQLTAELVPLLRAADAELRMRTAALLEALDWHPADDGEALELAVAKNQFMKAASCGSQAIELLLFAAQTAAPSMRPHAMEALGLFNDARVQAVLIEALNSPNASLSMAAIHALGRQGNAANFDLVAPKLKHDDSRVRLTAVESLAQIDRERAVEPLINLLQDPVWDVRRASAETLGRTQHPASVEPLIRALADPDADVREAAAIALAGLHDRRAIGPLVKALKDTTSGVRRIAATSLPAIDPNWSESAEARAAVEELKQSLTDKNPDVRYAVGRLLQSFGITPPETIQYLPELTYYYELQQSLGALSSRGASAAPEVLSVTDLEKRRKLATTLMMATLCDGDPELRRAAAHSLGRLGDPRAENALKRAAEDPDPGVRQLVDGSLRTIRQVRRRVSVKQTKVKHECNSSSGSIGVLRLAGSTAG